MTTEPRCPLAHWILIVLGGGSAALLAISHNNVLAQQFRGHSQAEPVRLSQRLAAPEPPWIKLDYSGLEEEFDLSDEGDNAPHTDSTVDVTDNADAPRHVLGLKERMERLEKQNRDLLKRLDQLTVEKEKPLKVNERKQEERKADKRPDEKKPDFNLKAKWNNGLEFQTEDKDFRVKIGGWTQVDASFLRNTTSLNGAGGALGADAVDVRRARLRLEGTMYKIFDWTSEFDFANTVNDNQGIQPATKANTINVPTITNMWLAAREVPVVGNIKGGVFKEPIGFEHLTADRFIDFMERSYNQDAYFGAFDNGFAPGLQINNTFDDEFGTWATGIFKITTNSFAWNVGDGQYAWTSRLTYLPIWDDEGQTMLHVGGSASIRDADGNQIRYRARGSLRNGPGALAPILADTGTFQVLGPIVLVNGEICFQEGPLVLQAEYTNNWNYNSSGLAAPIAGVPLGTVTTNGWYAEAMYFLTGESREYDRKTAIFGRVKPKRNFTWADGGGAWQAGVRFSQLNLRSGRLNGGLLNDVTFGLNWFLNPNTRLQWNYTFTHREGPFKVADGNINGFGMRMAYDF